MPALAVFVAICLLLRRTGKRQSSGWTHGTARTASFADLVKGRLLGKEGLILGSAGITQPPDFRQAITGLASPGTDSENACRQFFAAFQKAGLSRHRLIRLNEFVHLATFAPAGRGKSVCVLIPNLLAYAKSCVITDPKGELFEKTSAHRKRRFGHRIIRLDPFGLCGPGADSFNPLDFIDPDADDFLEQCRDLANMLIFRSGHEPDPHWCQAAELVLTAMIAYVCACEENAAGRTLDLVREIVSSRHCFNAALETMQKTESHGGVIQRLGHTLSWFQDRELGSVLTTVQRCTQFLDSPAVSRSTGTSSFDPHCLRSGRATAYLILPHDKLVTLAPLMRLWVGMLLRVITRGVPDETDRVLFLLDEAGHLGKIQVLEDAVTLLRGMGIRLWFFFQSPTQLQTCFGDKAQTILDNIETQQYFGVNSHVVAEELSKRIGEVTISTTTRGKTTGESRPVPNNGRNAGSVSTGTSFNYADIGRRLLKPEEIVLLPDEVALVFHRNLPVIPAVLLKYFEAEEFNDGGTGKQTGLGWRSALVAVALLVLSGFVVSLAWNLPTLRQPRRVRPYSAEAYWQIHEPRPSSSTLPEIE